MTLVQHASDAAVDKATISMVCGHGQGQTVSVQAQRIRLPSLSVFCRKPDLDTIVGRIRLMRTTMRKEAHLECDAIARTFDVGLEKLFIGVELFVRNNSSSFSTAFAHHRSSMCVSVRLTVRSRRSLQRCRMSFLGRSRNARRFTIFVESCFEFPLSSIDLLFCAGEAIRNGFARAGV